MSCTDSIVKNIVSDCTTARNGGTEVKAWILNRETYKNSITYDPVLGNKITNIASVVGAKAFTLVGVKKLLNAGHDPAFSATRPDRYTHYFSFEQFEIAAEDIANVDTLGDCIVIYERKDKATDGDGTFVALGVECGLNKTTSSRRENENSGARSIELGSTNDDTERYSEWTVDAGGYAATKSMLVALETAGV